MFIPFIALFLHLLRLFWFVKKIVRDPLSSLNRLHFPLEILHQFFRVFFLTSVAFGPLQVGGCKSVYTQNVVMMRKASDK